jgi:hypothetical protein
MNCGYYWQDEDEDYPCCHCPDDGFPAPCEYDDEDEEDYEDEYTLEDLGPNWY